MFCIIIFASIFHPPVLDAIRERKKCVTKASIIRHKMALRAFNYNARSEHCVTVWGGNLFLISYPKQLQYKRVIMHFAQKASIR